MIVLLFYFYRIFSLQIFDPNTTLRPLTKHINADNTNLWQKQKSKQEPKKSQKNTRIDMIKLKTNMYGQKFD